MGECRSRDVFTEYKHIIADQLALRFEARFDAKPEPIIPLSSPEKDPLNQRQT